MDFSVHVGVLYDKHSINRRIKGLYGSKISTFKLK